MSNENTSKPGANTKWEELLSLRELQEVHLAQIYTTSFNHGTTGHNQLLLIAKLADILNRAEISGTDIQKLFHSSDFIPTTAKSGDTFTAINPDGSYFPVAFVEATD